MTDRKLTRVEISLMAGVLCALLLGAWLGNGQAELAGRVLRLHVIANSDSEADQALKLAVRDKVLETAEAFYPEHATLEEARAALSGHLDELAAAGQEAVAAAGREDPVTARIETCWFPTKEYGDFALPAGRYEALRVVVGEGRGRNWWCVAFPPLCLGAAEGTVEEAAQAGLFTRDQARLITGDGPGYILRFKGMELLGKLQEVLP